jgi:hypothetical protein
MLETLIIGSSVIFANIVIQCAAVVILIRYLIKTKTMLLESTSFLSDITIVIIVLSFLFAGHVVQFSVWAGLFMLLNEFNDFNSALYHSIVNFSSLGYGDIVLSDDWRMLGALEACNGILMFGLSTGTIMVVMTRLFKRINPRAQSKNEPKDT